MTSSNARRAAALVGACVALMTSAPASATDHTTAVKRFEAGRALVQKGHCDRAIPEFEASLAAEPSIGANLNLADCYRDAGQWGDAWQHYKEAEALASRAGDGRIAPARRGVTGVASHLVILEVSVSPPIEGIEVKVDGTAMGTERLATGVPLEPGTDHRLEATAPGKKPFSKTVNAAGGTTTQVTIAMQDEARDVGGPRAATAQPAPVLVDRGATQRTVGLVVAGVGAVSMIVGGVFGLVALNKRGDLRSAFAASPNCRGTYPTGECSPGAQAELAPLESDMKTAGTFSTAFVLGGAVLTVGGIAAYVFAPKPTEVRPVVGRVPLRVGAVAGRRTAVYVEGAW